MASQLRATGIIKRKPRRSIDAELGKLPSIVAAREKRIAAKKKAAFEERKFARESQLQKDELALTKKRDMMSAGLSAANLGLGVHKLMQGGTAGQGLGKTVNQLSGKIGGGNVPMIGDMKVGNIASGGLIGFGASRFGGDNKMKKMALGAGAGALANMFLGGGTLGESAFSGLIGGLSGLV